MFRIAQPLSDKVTELDQLRNAALTGSETYTAKSLSAARYNLGLQVKAVSDSMPILTHLTAPKLAERVKEKVRIAVTSSIWGKVSTLGPVEEQTIESMIAYAKAQKKDSYYNFHYVHLVKRTGIYLPLGNAIYAFYYII